MRELYVPGEQIDALGWTTIAWHELEVVLSILVKALMPDRGSGDETIGWQQSIALLKQEVSRNRLPVPLRRPLNLICKEVASLAEDYANAATSILFARGAGALENLIIELAKATGEKVRGKSLTPLRIRALEARLRELTRRAAVFAQQALASQTR